MSKGRPFAKDLQGSFGGRARGRSAHGRGSNVDGVTPFLPSVLEPVHQGIRMQQDVLRALLSILISESLY